MLWLFPNQVVGGRETLLKQRANFSMRRSATLKGLTAFQSPICLGTPVFLTGNFWCGVAFGFCCGIIFAFAAIFVWLVTTSA